MLQLSLEVVVLRIESSDTMYSEVVQTWIPWCGASCPPLRGQSHRQRLVGELSESPSTKNLDLGLEVASVLNQPPHEVILRCQ
jgi:hypothetical protein